jgi:hypothetical protein
VKIFSVTTTVHVPFALLAYQRALPAAWGEFLVVGDIREPEDLAPFCKNAGVRFLSAAEQEVLGYRCSPLINFNCIQRRNIGFLEALKSGAEIIHSWDDDNLVLDDRYFNDIVEAMGFQTGIEISSATHWHDPGRYLVPKSKHRGFPYQLPWRPICRSTVRAKVGVVAGTCIGDPDVDSVTRMSMAPDVQQVARLVEAGYIVHPYTWTVFNSQATAIRREFVPAWFMWNHVGRMDDIYASLLVQRVMRDRGYCVHFGKPFAFQSRNEHNLVTDMRAEIDGYENVQLLAGVLDKIMLPGKSVIEDCRRIWETLDHVYFVDPRTVETAHAFLDDCQEIMK